MDLESTVAVMTYPLAALSVGLVSLPLFVVWRLVKALIRIEFGIWFSRFAGTDFFDQCRRRFRRPLGDKPHLHSGGRWDVAGRAKLVCCGDCIKRVDAGQLAARDSGTGPCAGPSGAGDKNVDGRDVGAKRSFVASPGHDEDSAEKSTRRKRQGRTALITVMPGLVPASTSLLAARRTWMAGTSPAMTASGCQCTGPTQLVMAGPAPDIHVDAAHP